MRHQMGVRLALGLATMLALSAYAGRSVAQTASDMSLTCPQIIAEVDHQNGVIKQQNDTKAQLENARPDPGAADPAIGERVAQIAADKATARAKTLVALGRQKGCYK